MITDKEVQAFWNRWDLIIISWNAISAFFILSVLSFFASIILYFFGVDWWIWLCIYGLLVPLNIFLKYGLRVKGLWLFNDTKDGDFGDPNEIEKAGHTGKNKLFIVIWWWFRNHSWNYINKFKPSCNSSKSQVFEYFILRDSRKTGNTEWLNSKGFFYICYRCIETGRVYCRYSKVTNKFEKHFGAGGDRYKLHYKLR